LSTSTGLLLKKERKKPEGSSVMFNGPGNSRVYDPPRRVSVWVKGKTYSKILRDR
jgi:hypothetical protein